MAGRRLVAWCVARGWQGPMCQRLKESFPGIEGQRSPTYINELMERIQNRLRKSPLWELWLSVPREKANC